MATVGAMVSTAYSADTSWNFARDHLGMTSSTERTIMFSAAEIGLFAMALMARQNLRTQGAAGTPGVLVWVVTAVMVIPAYSESGIIAGTVRAFVGPVMAALLWHLAMGIELRHVTGGDSQSLPAVLARELRERLLSWLGLAVRGRDAAQITRDRWTRIATHRAARLADLEATTARPWRLRRARRRLAEAVDHTDAAVLPAQRAVLLDRIAAHHHAAALATVALPSPWQTAPAPAPDATAGVEVERVPAPVPVPEVQATAYPQLPPAARAVPQAVPAGARLLPLVARPAPVPAPSVLAAEPPRTRAEVRAEYVPEAPEPGEYATSQITRMMLAEQAEPVDDSPPPPAEDTLTARARADFLSDLVAGDLPTYRALKAKYGIGQIRAERIRAELERFLP